MQAEQLSVLDLPPDNVLGILPRFGISGEDGNAIAQFADMIGQIRLDQLDPQRASSGKNPNQLQPNLPIEIAIAGRSPALDSGDRANIEVDKLDISGIFSDTPNIPEISIKTRQHGIIEDYLVKGRGGKLYKYQRYVYLDGQKTYRHHHIPQKQIEAISALWRSGASCQQICVALGKKYLGKDI